MKSLIILITWLGPLCLAAFAQEGKTNSPIKITANEAKKYIGTNAIVSGKIVEVSKAEKLVRINFEKPFPDQPFTAIIFASKTNLFPDLGKLQDKRAEVTGNIVDYRGRPQIILTETNQLKIVEKGDANK